jgi:hypothetical protein
MSTESATYGTTEVATSKRLSRSDGCSYRAIDSRQNGRVEYESAFGAAVICEAAFKTSYGTRVLAFKRSRGGRRAAAATNQRSQPTGEPRATTLESRGARKRLESPDPRDSYAMVPARTGPTRDREDMAYSSLSSSLSLRSARSS